MTSSYYDETGRLISSAERSDKVEQIQNQLFVSGVGNEYHIPSDPDDTFYQKFGIPNLRTRDGHFVRSAGERTIADYFYDSKINYVYECPVALGRFQVCDFYLPGHDCYVEFWGMVGKPEYDRRMEEKIGLYAKNGLRLISVFEEDLSNLKNTFSVQLAGMGIVAPQLDCHTNSLFQGKAGSENFVAIDFETANYQRNSACSLGVVLVENENIVFKKLFLIRPPTKQFVFTYIHGIRWIDVMHSPSFLEIWPELKSILDRTGRLVAHNMPFDKSVLFALAELYSIQVPDYKYECTLKLSRSFLDLSNNRLSTVSEHFGIELDHHDALSDAEACAKIRIHFETPRK